MQSDALKPHTLWKKNTRGEWEYVGLVFETDKPNIFIFRKKRIVAHYVWEKGAKRLVQGGIMD